MNDRSYLAPEYLKALRRVVAAALEVTSPCDHSEDVRGYCVGHGGIFRLPCPYAELNDALAELNATADIALKGHPGEIKISNV